MAQPSGCLLASCRLWVFAQFLVAWSPRAAGLVPPSGIALPAEIRAELASSAAELGRDVGRLQKSDQPLARTLWPDVAVLHKAVDWALRYDEFHGTNQFAQARQLLTLGRERASLLASGVAPWTLQTGLVVRGFVSRIDDSVQPYGVVVPPGWRPNDRPRRLDVWLAGRDERRTELKFISERLRSPGDFTPPDTVVLHPYGRFCNAYKFAGETDVFEAVAHAEAAYGTDPDRRSVRGFSMGGAGAWHLAAHYPWFWRAASPGAGFVDTANYTGVLKHSPAPAPWEQTLWRLYDVPGYAANFHQLDVIAYSGELDKQKLAADTMAAALRQEGLELDQVIGPGVEHKFEPGAKRELARRLDERMATPKDRAPRQVEFATFTLRYPDHGQVGWFALEGLQRHWEQARVQATVLDAATVSLRLTNVAAFRLVNPPGLTARRVHVLINDQSIAVGQKSKPATPFEASFELRSGKWRTVRSFGALRKRPGLQGPIDDAFMGRFLVVRPTGRPWNPTLATWSAAALDQFIADWRGQFRGDVRVKADTEITNDDLLESHLVLWGDPGSNHLLARLVRKLPIGWTRDTLTVGQGRFPSAEHLPVLICPNPLNPERYLVLNSGHTFASWNGTNARQTPWLPDWAVLALKPGDTPPTAVAAGFFDEAWKPKRPSPQQN